MVLHCLPRLVTQRLMGEKSEAGPNWLGQLLLSARRFGKPELCRLASVMLFRTTLEVAGKDTSKGGEASPRGQTRQE